MSAAIEVFEKNESGVRSYCRKFPKEFTHARNAILTDTDGNEYIDFFAGAGAINYGHNNPYNQMRSYTYHMSNSYKNKNHNSYEKTLLSKSLTTSILLSIHQISH